MTARTAGGKRLASATWRIGEMWEWWPKARQLSDNSLKPRERRAYTLRLPVPHDSPGGKLTVELAQENRRVTDENAGAMNLLADYPRAAVVRRLETRIRIVAE